MLIFNADINNVITERLDASRHSIKIIMYSISLPNSNSHLVFKTLWQALVRACSRVEKAECIFSGWPESNPQHAATHASAETLRRAGADCIVAEPGTIIHPKTWCFDDKWLIVGSHNATNAGMTTTRNISYMGRELTEIALFNAYFRNEWQNVLRQKERAKTAWQR